MWKNIIDKIEDKLKTIDKIQEVHKYPVHEFDGYPAAIIAPEGQESDFETTASNQRTYVAEIKILQETKHATVDGAYEIMLDLIDDVLDKFDSDQGLSGVTIPTGYTMLTVEAVPSSVLPVADLENMIMTTITVRVRVEVDINQI